MSVCSSVVEHVTDNDGVAGSIPATRTMDHSRTVRLENGSCRVPEVTSVTSGSRPTRFAQVHGAATNKQVSGELIVFPMHFFFRLILSIILFAFGILCMKYSVFITDQLSGRIDLAEKYLGTGVGAGTYTWWKLFGLIMCILSVGFLLGKIRFGF